MQLYLDLDGVMSDLDTHYLNLFGVHHEEQNDRKKFWKDINGTPDFFGTMPVFEGHMAFFYTLHDIINIESTMNGTEYKQLKILTSCSRSNYKQCAIQKRQWVYKNIADYIDVLPVMGGVNKALFMHSKGDILIDDMERNCDAWSDMCGKPILHTSFEDTLEKLIGMI